MPVEFIGMIATRPHREYEPYVPGGAPVDREYVKQFARVHEDGGFDRALIGYGAAWPDGWSVASYAGAFTDRLGILLAHRPGFIAPTLAARKAATLDHFLNGRLAIHIITGGSDEEQARDGDFLPKDERYQRSDEYLEVVKLTWTNGGPFDYDGKYYHVKGAATDVKPVQKPHIPLYFGGSSDIALEVAAKRADTWALWGEPVEEVNRQARVVRAKAAEYGRTLGISVSFRPILASTEEKAWERANTILAKMKANRGEVSLPRPQNAGSQRLLDFAAKKDVYDKRLWTPLATASNAQGNSTALVGTPDQVAEALLDYVDAGVTTLLIRGYDPLEDAIEYGRDLLPIVRAEVAKRDRERAQTANELVRAAS